MSDNEEIKIGSFTITKVHPDMVRVLNEETADAKTFEQWEFEENLERLLQEF